MGSQNFGNEDDERSVDPESEQGRDRLERTTRCLSKAMEGLRRHEYTAELLRTLLDSMETGASATDLAELATRLQACMDPAGAGERGVLAVYNDLLEQPGT